ncbi:MAG: MBL fold metallo-hydrolase [Acidimicrobiia bacterium]|nr:MAG: MBL fold metallo-hydrolase [Acidimicrobiia bacterium]
MAQITIQKLGDSCLRVEVGDHSALIDPGFYVWGLAELDLTAMPAPDRLLITHSHPDHLSLEFVQALVTAHPAMVIESNEDVVAQLADAGIEATTDSVEWTAQFTTPHQQTPTGSQPQNIGFVVGGVFAHAGDSYTFDAAPPVLALPLLPPWGSSTEAVILAKRLKPQYIIPTHDWHLEQRGRQWLYGAIEQALAAEGITVLPLDDFETVSLDVD